MTGKYVKILVKQREDHLIKDHINFISHYLIQ